MIMTIVLKIGSDRRSDRKPVDMLIRSRYQIDHVIKPMQIGKTR